MTVAFSLFQWFLHVVEFFQNVVMQLVLVHVHGDDSEVEDEEDDNREEADDDRGDGQTFC